jgi:HAD superfamily hydrolase (TIGR01490 family)
MSKPYAAFDIDGTLIRWQLYHALADELARMGILDPIQYEKVREIRMNWKRRDNADSFDTYEKSLVNLVDSVMPGLVEADFQIACEVVIEEYKDQVYTYTRDLLRDLKDKGYLLFAISASHAPLVGMLAEHYGFDDFGGTEYPVKDGRFTGEKHLLRSKQKPVYLRKLIEKHGASQAGSIAVGDSESDIPMLMEVERPIAFNPTRELFAHAREKGWQIVVERKSVAYRLEPGDGSYILA